MYINGEKFEETVYLDCTYEVDFERGDVISFDAVIKSIEDTVEEGTLTKLSVLSQGYAYCLYSEEDMMLLIDEKESPRTFLESLNGKLSAEYKRYLGKEAGALASALALGNQSSVPDDVSKAFRRSGLAHILALSGSHIVLIIGTMDKFLLSGLKMRRKLRSVLMLAAVPLYVMLVMSPIPVVRAGVMYMLMCVGVLCDRESDSMTNLFMSVFLMVMVNPALLFSVSLWMSFLATLALIIFMPMLTDKLKSIRQKSKHPVLFKAFAALFMSVAMCLLGTSANLIFSYATFGEMSTVSLPANIMFGPVLTFLLAVYMIFLFALPFPPLALALSAPIKFISEATVDLIEIFSSFKYSVISLRGGVFAFVCVVIFVLCCLFLTVKVKHGKIAVTSMAVLVGLLFGAQIMRMIDRSSDVEYTDYSMNENAVVRVGDDFALIDVSNGRYTSISKSVTQAKNAGATEFESVILTHYHSYHAGSLSKLFDRETVRNLLLPMPEREEDIYQFERIIELCERKDVSYSVFDKGIPAEFLVESYISDLNFEFIERSTHPIVSYKIKVCDKEIVYVGASNVEGENHGFIKNAAENADFAVFGRHGPVPKVSAEYSFSDKTLLFIIDEKIAEFIEYGNFGADREYIIRPDGIKIKIR